MAKQDKLTNELPGLPGLPGRPATGKAKTTAQRQAEYRARQKERGDKQVTLSSEQRKFLIARLVKLVGALDDDAAMAVELIKLLKK